MNDNDTRANLIAVARDLFARRGFKGTTIRAITTGAHANLGAVTYHFGSKRALYHAVLEHATTPIRAQVQQSGTGSGTANDRLEQTIRGLFRILAKHQDVPRLILQVLSAEEPLPPPIQTMMKSNLDQFVRLVTAGQRDRSIRDGSPMFLALCVAAQPIFFGIYRRALQEAIGLDQSKEETTGDLVDTAIGFIRAGLAR